MTDITDAIKETQNGARQTVIHTMTKRARELDKKVEPVQMQSMAREMEDIVRGLWERAVQGKGESPEPHEVIKEFTDYTLDWCGEHLGWKT